MSALRDITLNVRPAVLGLIAEIEKCTSVAEVKPLTNELRFWLDGDPLSIVNMLKARLQTNESRGDTPKMIIREMEELGEDMTSECESREGGSVIELPEVSAIFSASPETRPTDVRPTDVRPTDVRPTEEIK